VLDGVVEVVVVGLGPMPVAPFEPVVVVVPPLVVLV
jgi:hypothetical protein